ncbi:MULTISPECIES: hypothetical protein [Thalassospira]|uniref:hypothetical protein n=1 Tax=Thalassospira TaxID=168934 RepID=UPI0011BF2ED0|nr:MULTISPECIES: hypothetical protein [Thalassospira]
MSVLSPGWVEDGEELYRAAFSPLHLETNGELKPDVFFSDAFQGGCSCDRKNYTSEDEVVSKAIEKAEKDNDAGKKHKTFSHLVAMSVEPLRKINFQCSGSRALAVYDTATEENRAHAEIFVVFSNSKSSKLGRAAKAGLRNQLLKAAEKIEISQ